MTKRIATWALPCIVLFFCLTSSGNAADVQSSVSTSRTYVNLPFTLQIQINNAASHDKPSIPEVDGLEIVPKGPPSRSFRTTIINGRTTQRNTLTYLYSVTATREGEFTIPAVKVVVNGEETQTSEVRVIATQSETDDLMFVEIAGKDNQIYVGEALQLTLKIWVRAYHDQQFNITLNEANMWTLISRQSKWGNFEEALREMGKNRRRPEGKLTLREDSEGKEHEYLLYEIDTTIYPDRPGELDGNDVRIILNYPEKLGRSRSPFAAFGDDFFGGAGGFGDDMFPGFGSHLRVTDVRPIITQTEVEPITVKPIPEQGRPVNYRGAVGDYRIISEASPTTVKVGDPIRLNIGIAGKGRLELLRAPPLTEQQDLIHEFKVPNQPLAGFVDGSQKIFSTTIRPLRKGTEQIPGIEYSFFNPKTEQFVSIKSDPITINVEEAELLALDAIVGNQTGTPTAALPNTPAGRRSATTMAEISQNVLASVARPNSFPSALLIFLLLPPIVVAAIALHLYRHSFSSLVSARYRFKKAMIRATTPQEVADGLEQFLQSRYRLPVSRTLRDQTVGSLRALGHYEIAIDVERLYHECDRDRDSKSTAHYSQNAQELVNTLCESNRRRGTQSRMHQAKAPYLNTKSALVLLALLISPSAASTTLASDSLPATQAVENTGFVVENPAAKVSTSPEPSRLTEDQINQMLAEASELYQTGISSQDESESSSSFSQAAERLQILVDAGITNDELFATLANAQARSGNTANAVANYRRALRYAPENQTYHDRLTEAETGLGTSLSPPRSQLARARTFNDFVLHFVSPKGMLVLALLAWTCSWAVIAWRLISGPQHWKLPMACLFLLAFTAIISYQLRVSEFLVDNQAVVTQSDISLREGDGNEFGIALETPFLGGDLVEVLDQRGSWHKVRLSGGQSGWLPSNALQMI